MFQEAQSSRRLPVYLLADRSASMDGDPMVAVNEGLRLLKEDLEHEPRAVDTVWLSLISFGGQARIDVPLTELMAFYPPQLDAEGSTPLGEALTLLNQCIDNDVHLSTGKGTGDYKPLVFLFTDGEPTDDWRSAAHLVKQRATAQTANIIAIGCGPQANSTTLREITESVMVMDQITAGQFKKLMQWISMSVKSASIKATTPAGGAAPAATATLPPVPQGFTIAF